MSTVTATDDPPIAVPTPDARLPPVPRTLGPYDGPTATTDRVQEAKLMATAQSTLHPLYRRAPGDCLLLLYRAQALNIPTGIAVDHIYINTAIGRSGLSAQLMAAMLLRAGIRWRVRKETDQVVELRFYRGRRMVGTVDWKIREAVAAGLTQREHWRLWTTDCLWARAMARGCRRFFSDVVMGMGYTPEELHDMTGHDAAPDEVETLPPAVQALIDDATADDATADTVRHEVIPAARKAKLLGYELPDGRTLQQALGDAWRVAASHDSAARADAALAQLDSATAAEAAVFDAPAGTGHLPCGCPTDALISGHGHVRGVCHGALVTQH